MGTKYYLLFGSEAIKTYYEFHDANAVGSVDSYKRLAEAIKEKEHAVFLYDSESSNPFNLLAAYDGWGGWDGIPKTLYELLKP